MEPVWGWLGIGLGSGSVWGQFGITLGSVLGHLESVWGHFGIWYIRANVESTYNVEAT